LYKTEAMSMYKTFIRTWWRPNKDWPDGLEPHAGKKRTVGGI
jgi:hypothetical protein